MYIKDDSATYTATDDSIDKSLVTYPKQLSVASDRKDSFAKQYPVGGRLELGVLGARFLYLRH